MIKTNMRRAGRKVLSGLLTMVMMFSALNITAFASEGAVATQAEKQIVSSGSTVYYDAQGNAVAEGEDYDVALSKTIAATGTENVFDITLGVKTAVGDSSSLTYTPDSAVVLTVDASVTMNNDMNGRTRLSIAKEEAKKFVAKYAATAEGTSAARWLAITRFAGSASLAMNWIDASDVDATALLNATSSAGLTGNTKKVYDAIYNIAVSSDGTNLEAATLLSRNLFKYTDNTAVKAITKDYRWAIIIGDGGPSVTINPNVRDTSSTSSISGYAEGYNGYHNTYAGTDFSNIDDLADYTDVNGVKRSGYMNWLSEQATPIMVGFSTNMDDVSFDTYEFAYGFNSDHAAWLYRYGLNSYSYSNSFSRVTPSVYNSQGGFLTVSSWLANLLKQFNGDWHAATNAEGLGAAFDSILENIKTKTQTKYTTGWAATDPVGGSVTPYVEFVNFIGAGGALKNALTKEADGDKASYNGEIEWDVLASTPIKVGEYNYYEITYRVKLNTLSKDDAGNPFVAGVTHETNGNADFKWTYADSDGNFQPADGDFPHPSVKGYTGDLSFTKLDETGKALAGAEFKLYTGAWSVTATSDENGTVSFTGIPSGHSYSLAEISTPDNEKYVLPAQIWNVSVAYGEVTHNIADATITNYDKPEDSVDWIPYAKKTVNGRIDLASTTFNFEVKDASGAVVSTGTSDANGDVTFTPVTFTTPGTYKFRMSEVSSAADAITYDATVWEFTVEVLADVVENGEHDVAGVAGPIVTRVAVDGTPAALYCGYEVGEIISGHAHSTADCSYDKTDNLLCTDAHHTAACDPTNDYTKCAVVHVCSEAECSFTPVYNCAKISEDPEHVCSTETCAYAPDFTGCATVHEHDETCDHDVVYDCGAEKHDDRHTDECYELNFTCGVEEAPIVRHESHAAECYVNPDPQPTEDIATYYNAIYTVTYEYTGDVPANAPPVPAPADYKAGTPVTVADDPALDGYTFSGWDRSDFTMPAHDVVIYGSWTSNYVPNPPPPTTYTLIVNYVDTEGNVLHPQIVTSNMASGSPYTTEQKSFEGYTFVETTGDAVSGVMNSNKVVTYIYEPDETILDVDPPLTDIPEDEEILDEDVPLADVPETGDINALWYGLTALSACGLAGLAITGKKHGKREDEE